MTNETKTFRLKHRRLAIASLVPESLLALFTLIATVARWNAYLPGEVVDWRNSWWLTALFFAIFVYALVDSLREVFLQLILSKEGIWYHQFGSKRFIPWEQVEGVGFTRTFLTREKQYRLILKAEPKEDKKTFLARKQDNPVIPLSVFVDRWLGSELRDEIKRLNPSLPM
jgi:hypothetical protein